MKKQLLALSIFLSLSAPAFSDLNFGDFDDDGAPFILGEDYTIIGKEVDDTDVETIDVINFFSYGCSECLDVSKSLEKWRAKMPYNAKLYNSPISPTVESSYPARIYFTFEKLNRLDLNIPFFEASLDGKTNFSDLKVLRSWMDGRGIKSDVFDAAFDSNEVVSKIYSAPNIIKMYELTSVPTITIDGKYKIDALSIQKNKENLPELVEFLVNKKAKDIQKKN